MKLEFPGGEHPQVLLGPGVSRVGSDPQSTIVLKGPGVRPRHCELHVTGHGVMLQVPHGAEVRVNGRAVDGLITLRPGDTVDIDHVLARLSPLDAAVTDLPTPANDDPGATAVRPVLPRFVLRGHSAGALGRSHAISKPTVVGRASDCGLRLGTSGLSRHHARLIPTNDGLQVEDLGSTNGTTINGERVQRGLVRPGDELGFDLLRFRLEVPGMVPVLGAEEADPAARRSAWRSPRLWAAIGLLLAAAIALAAFLR